MTCKAHHELRNIGSGVTSCTAGALSWTSGSGSGSGPEADDQVRARRRPANTGVGAVSRAARQHVVASSQSGSNFRRRYVFLVVVLVLLGLGLLVGYLVLHLTPAASPSDALVPPNPEVPQPPSQSVLHSFRRGAVCADGAPCSVIGNDILKKNGSAIDATIAALFCNGVVNGQSMGLGGGFLMTIYSAREGTAHVLDAREAAPRTSSTLVFKDQQEAQVGPKAVCVPGELRGYWAAHQRYGRLKWSELIAPTIQLCRNGYYMTRHQYQSLSLNKNVRTDKTLRDIFVDPETGEFRRAGTLVKLNRLCDTLQVISDEGGDALYNGTLSDIFAKDLSQIGTIITKEDLAEYKPKWRKPVSVELRDGIKFFSVPPPGSGALLGFILSVLDGYGFSNASVADIPSSIVTYHRIIEAFKYAFGFRTKLGDPDFVNISQELQLLTSKRYAEEVRHRIKDTETNNDPANYGGVFFNPPDSGTAHVSVISADGDAVSVTSTLDIYFGSGVTSPETGITLSSGMDDFSWKDFVNYFNLPGSPANTVAPGKRPLSSMSPSVLVDRNGNVRMVVGASGGTKIPSAVAMAIIRHLWFGEDVKVAVDSARIHHQLFPMEVSYEYGVLDQIVKGLEKLGHKTSRYRNAGSVVCAISKLNGNITANADFRKGGEVYGY